MLLLTISFGLDIMQKYEWKLDLQGEIMKVCEEEIQLYNNSFTKSLAMF